MTPKKKTLLLVFLLPFAIFFLVGSGIGWWLVDRDSGKYRASFSQDEPLKDYVYPTVMTGLVLGATAGILALSGYGCFGLIRKSGKR